MTNAEIQVGEYVRTKEGILGKFEGIDEYHRYTFEHFEDTIYCIKTQEEQEYIRLKYAPKHSFNLIDLIEAGDYVNGDKVELSRDKALYVACNYLGGIGVRTLESYYTYVEDMKEEDIETIVTHEQFKAMEYKVGGEDE